LVSLGEWPADALPGVGDLTAGALSIGEGGGLTLAQSVEAVLQPDDQAALVGFGKISHSYPDVGSGGAFQSHGDGRLAQRCCDLGSDREAAQLPENPVA